MTSVDCSNVTSLDSSSNKMTCVDCSSNKMTSVDCSNVTSLYSSSNKMTSVDCSSNKMTSVDGPSDNVSGMNSLSNSSRWGNGSSLLNGDCRSSHDIMDLSVFNRGNHIFSFDGVDIVYVDWSD